MKTKILTCIDCGAKFEASVCTSRNTRCRSCSRIRKNERKQFNYRKTHPVHVPRTKIELDPLFVGSWDSAYIVHHKKEDRDYVILRNSKTDMRTTMQLARYKMCVKLGRLLTDDEQVDHIDGNKKNDSIDNLQILRKTDHIAKTVKEMEERTAIRRKNRTPRHGTAWEHIKYKCNCSLCVAAYREYTRKQSAKHRAKLKLETCR